MGGSHPRGIDVDTNGIVWTPLAGEGVLASFDRSKCKMLMDEAATTGRHCREGWAFYPIPGSGFQDATRREGGLPLFHVAGPI